MISSLSGYDSRRSSPRAYTVSVKFRSVYVRWICLDVGANIDHAQRANRIIDAKNDRTIFPIVKHGQETSCLCKKKKCPLVDKLLL